MLDRWTHNATKPSPEKRAQKQLRALRAETLKTARAIGKSYPNSSRGDELRHQHQQRVTKILQWGRKPPPPRCSVCGKILPQPTELWTDSLPLKLLWSATVTLVFCLVGFFFGWIALVVPAVAWVVSFSFLCSISVPFLLFILLLLILIPFGG